MLHISLFSGIGGFDLAANWAGWDNIVSCEINPFCNQVLSHYWPNTYHHNDIKNLNYEKINEELTKRRGENWRSDDIVLSGGFPCQPYSLAGKRKGKEDDRHLWPEMLRVIREVQPRWVVGENVFGLVNWDGGLVFEEVQSDLEAEGYEVQPYVLPACGVNAPHRRDRIWFVAYTNHARGSARSGEVQRQNGEVSERDDNAESSDTGAGIIANAGSIGNGKLKRLYKKEENRFFENYGGIKHVADPDPERREDLHTSPISSGPAFACWGDYKKQKWTKFPAESPVCGRDDGLSAGLDGITFPKWRNESIKAYGNAVVPQLVYQIFKAINKMQCNYKPHNNS